MRQLPKKITVIGKQEADPTVSLVWYPESMRLLWRLPSPAPRDWSTRAFDPHEKTKNKLELLIQALETYGFTEEEQYGTAVRSIPACGYCNRKLLNPRECYTCPVYSKCHQFQDMYCEYSNSPSKVVLVMRDGLVLLDEAFDKWHVRKTTQYNPDGSTTVLTRDEWLEAQS